MKILVLVLTHNDQLYNFFDKIKERYLYSKNIDFKFIYNGLDSTVHDPKNNRLNYYTDEGPIPAMLKKFINYIETSEGYDLIIRMNSSTFINIDKVVERVENLHGDLYMGFFERDWNFCSGALTVFSRSVIQKIVENKDKLDYNIEDDVSIGRLLQGLGVNKTYLDRYNISDRVTLPTITEIKEALTYPQIRIRNDHNRDIIDTGIWHLIEQELDL